MRSEASSVLLVYDHSIAFLNVFNYSNRQYGDVYKRLVSVLECRRTAKKLQGRFRTVIN